MATSGIQIVHKFVRRLCVACLKAFLALLPLLTPHPDQGMIWCSIGSVFTCPLTYIFVPLPCFSGCASSFVVSPCFAHQSNCPVLFGTIPEQRRAVCAMSICDCCPLHTCTSVVQPAPLLRYWLSPIGDPNDILGQPQTLVPYTEPHLLSTYHYIWCSLDRYLRTDPDVLAGEIACDTVCYCDCDGD